MNSSLETKLAQIVNYLDRRQFGGVLRPSQDDQGLRSLLNDREVAAWLDCKRMEGIPTGPLIDGRTR